jgi:hypothetical protein
MSDETKIVGMEFKEDKAKAALERFKRSIDVQIELQQHFAKIRRAAFEAYIAEGFSEEQALELCKSITA